MLGGMLSLGGLAWVRSISAVGLSSVVLGSLLLACPALAQDRWTDPYPGVRHLARRASGPRQIDALVIDLCAAGISLRATTEAESAQTVPAWASSVGVELAVNGDFFNPMHVPRGAAMGNGVAWGVPDNAAEGFVAFGRDQLELSPDAQVIDPLPAWTTQVIGGKPWLLRAGAVVDDTRELCTVRHPRTALGLSRDRQTLLLMVVDGRSSESIGMTCSEEAAVLRELGAWDAINLDGGGSSAMWVRGTGLLNVPSDGTPRVVANHLGVHAGGTGAPGSCMPYAPYEDELDAGSYATASSDVDGDGRADVCARGPEGIECALSSGAAFAPTFSGPALSDALSWRDPSNYRTIAMGDVTGDGRADLCARGNAGLLCWASTGDGFASERLTIDELSDALGWDDPEHYATIRLADVDGDGDDDVCARAAVGFRCWPSLGDRFGEASAPIAALSDAAGGSAIDVWATIRMGDVTGDGRADACARIAAGLRCWASTGAGFDADAITGPAWSDERGWRAHEHYSTVRLVDVDGDARADVCARADAGLHCHLSTGDAFGDAIVLAALADASGWDDPANYGTIELADIDGDGDRDACARASVGVQCWRFAEGGFGARLDGPSLDDDSGWWRAQYGRTLRFADIDGDGEADLCARQSTGLRCWPSNGGAFGAAIAGPAWTNDLGWWDPSYHATIRVAGGRGPERPPVEVDAGVSGQDASVPAEDDAGTSTDRVDASLRLDSGVITAESPGGCGCRAGGRSSGAAVLFGAALLGLACRRRRRAAQA